VRIRVSLEQVLHAGVHLLQDRALIAERGLLRQIADAEALALNDLAAVRLDLPDDQLQDRTLAGAVGPDHAHLLSCIEAKAQSIQNHFRPEGPMNVT